jgi:hypothetical protein
MGRQHQSRIFFMKDPIAYTGSRINASGMSLLSISKGTKTAWHVLRKIAEYDAKDRPCDVKVSTLMRINKYLTARGVKK